VHLPALTLTYGRIEPRIGVQFTAEPSTTDKGESHCIKLTIPETPINTLHILDSIPVSKSSDIKVVLTEPRQTELKNFDLMATHSDGVFWNAKQGVVGWVFSNAVDMIRVDLRYKVICDHEGVPVYSHIRTGIPSA
jgi:hypothetical protein